MADLVLRGGTVIDPGQGIEGPFDVVVEDDRLAGVVPEAVAPDGTRVVDVRGKYVVPGLIDLHTHLFWGVHDLGLDADNSVLTRGVTTAVDGGSCGSENFPAFRRWVVESSRTRVYCFIHLSALGLTAMRWGGELSNAAFADPDGAAEILRSYPDVAVGLKIRVEEVQVGGTCLPMLRMARQVCDGTGTPLMVHIGKSMESLTEILEWLGPGDIVTHCMTARGYGLLDSDERILPQVVEARQRGVLFDSAHGGMNFSHRVAARLLEQGFLPDAISTDLSQRTVDGPVYDLLTIVSKFVHMGLSLSEAIRLSTWRPAQILRRESEFGALAPGLSADITVLDWQAMQLPLKDSLGDVMVLDRRLVPILTIRGGQIVEEKLSR